MLTLYNACAQVAGLRCLSQLSSLIYLLNFKFRHREDTRGSVGVCFSFLSINVGVFEMMKIWFVRMSHNTKGQWSYVK